MADAKNNVGALAAIDELRIDSKIGKSKHFNASDRKLFWHRLCGVPVIVANLFVGIVLVSLQGAGTPGQSLTPQQTTAVTNISNGQTDSTMPSVLRPSEQVLTTSKPVFSSGNSGLLGREWLGLLSIFLAFGAASLSSVQTFFNFHKASEGHRAIGNRYVNISRQCKALQQKHRDIPYSPEAMWEEYLKLYAEYHQTNTEAEAFPTNSADLKQAKTAPEISPYKNPGLPESPKLGMNSDVRA